MGAAWIFQVAFAAGPNVTQQPFEANANTGCTPQEYRDIANAHASSVRVMIGQPIADPQDPLYSAAFVQQFVGAAQVALAAGLTVIVVIQDEAISGETNMLGLPGPATLHVWQQLVPAFKSDKGLCSSSSMSRESGRIRCPPQAIGKRGEMP